MTSEPPGTDPGTALAESTNGTPPSATIESPMTNGELDTLFRFANALHQSGYFKDTKTAQQALAKILFGRDLGVSATAALTGVHIIEGKPEISANLQAQMVRRGGYDYRVVTPLDKRDEECEIAFLRDGDEIGRERFTLKDAARAGLAGKDVWKKYPRNLLFARCMSNGVAFHCPEVVQGIRVYAEGELQPQTPVPVVTDTASLPPLLDAALTRAIQIDPRRFRRNEVAARVLTADGDVLEGEVENVMGELSAFLAEQEPVDGEVVEEPRSVSSEDAEVLCDEKWGTDPAWRTRVNRALGVVMDSEDDPSLAPDNAQFDAARAVLAAAGVPEGWSPPTGGDA